MKRSIYSYLLVMLNLFSEVHASSPMDCSPDWLDEQLGQSSSPVISDDEDMDDAEEEQRNDNPNVRLQLYPIETPAAAVAVRKHMKRSGADAGLDAACVLMGLREDGADLKPFTPQQRDQFIEEYYRGKHDLTKYTLDQLGISPNDRDFIRKVYTNDVFMYFVLNLCKDGLVNPNFLLQRHRQAIVNTNMRAVKDDLRAKYNMWYIYHHGIGFDRDEYATRTFSTGLPDTVFYVTRPGEIFVQYDQPRIDSSTQFKLEDED